MEVVRQEVIMCINYSSLHLARPSLTCVASRAWLCLEFGKFLLYNQQLQLRPSVD